MNRSFIFLFATLFLSLQCTQSSVENSSENELILSGEISGIEGTSISLVMQIAGSVVEDTLELENGQFTYQSELSIPTYVQLVGKRNQRIMFFVTPGNIHVKANMQKPDEIEVTGSKVQDQAIAFDDEMKIYNDALDSLMQQYRNIQQAGQWDLQQGEFMVRYELADSIRKLAVKSYLEDHGEEEYSAFLIQRNFMLHSDATELAELYNFLKGSGADNPWAEEVKHTIDIKEKTAVGQPFIDFEQADTSGQFFRLSELKGKVILVDFWASWCGPCRQENPNVVKAYEKYQDQGFEILGVSLDTERAKWLEAIYADELNWYHVSDLKGWQNEVADKYGVRAIPANILIDKNGIIVEKNIRGEALQETIPNYL